MVRNHRGRSSRGTISCVTNGWRLHGRSPKVRCLSKLGAHTNLDWARRVCVYFGVCITTAVSRGGPWVAGKLTKPALNPGEPTRVAACPWGVRAREGQSTRMSVSLVSVAPHHLWIDVSVGGSVPSEAASSGVRGGWHGRNVGPV